MVIIQYLRERLLNVWERGTERTAEPAALKCGSNGILVTNGTTRGVD